MHTVQKRVCQFLVLLVMPITYVGIVSADNLTTDNLPADNLPADNSSKNFQFSISPYAWLIGIKGTVGLMGQRAEVNHSFFDVRDHIDYAGMLAADVIFNNQFGAIGTFNYVKLSKTKAVRGISLGADTTLKIGDLAALYRVGSFSFGANDNALMNIDLLAGARFWNVDLNLNVGARDMSRRQSWTNPIIGARVGYFLDNKWRVHVQGDIGGTSSSSNTWSASALIGYSFSQRGEIIAGYRAIGVERKKGNPNNQFIFDTTLQGPIIGLTFNF